MENNRPDICAEGHLGQSVFVDLPGALEMIDTFDRPGKAFAAGTYADAETFAVGFENKPGKRLPKAGVRAAAGVGHAQAEWSIFDAEAKGPNASAEAGVSAASLSASALARAEVASASASAGPVKAEAKGPNASAGAKASAASLRAFAKAELASASASAGPLKAKVGLAADTGVSVGQSGIEAKVLGTGISIGPTTSISLFGNEIGFKLW